MDFFDRQQSARARTRRLVPLLLLAILFIIPAVYVVVLPVYMMLLSSLEIDIPFWNPEVFWMVALVTIGIITLGSSYKMRQLSKGGRVVARFLGGREIDPRTRRLEERRVINVVEEMAIASGLPSPPVYVLPWQKGINAFAAGFTPSNAVLGVTRGCLENLTREELEGVIGHEFSHILNGDMRMNMRLMGLIHGILVVGLIGRWIWERSLEADGPDPLAVLLGMPFGAALIAVGSLGVFCGRLIKGAMCRQREFLADASAVQFTRNPSGLAGALKKIGGQLGSRVLRPNAEVASHLYFSNGLRPSIRSWLSTHPPLVDRVRRLEPGFDGFFEVESSTPVLQAPILDPGVGGVSYFAGVAPAVTSHHHGSMPVSPESVSVSVGALDQAHLAYARSLLASLPEELTASAHDPTGACALVYALLLDADDDTREHQLALLRETTPAEIYAQTLALDSDLGSSPPETRIPLLDLSLGTLRHLSEAQYDELYENVRRLVTADERINLFDFLLQRNLKRQLDAHFGRTKPPRYHHYNLTYLEDECAVLLSALAHAGGRAEIESAFAAALAELGTDVELLPPENCDLQKVDRALRLLESLAPRLKRNVIRGCTACVVADRRITLEEGELLRAIADSLDCPVPPFLPGQTV
jgi:Zn-dependent protease with chaperone function